MWKTFEKSIFAFRIFVTFPFARSLSNTRLKNNFLNAKAMKKKDNFGLINGHGHMIFDRLFFIEALYCR